MIRRDYIMEMIEEFVRALARLNSLKAGQRWNEAGEALDGEFRRLVGEGPEGVARLSEMELLARLMRDGTRTVRTKCLMLVALLKEAGDIAAAQGGEQESRACYLKALHLLLDTLSREDVLDCPAFVPNIELLRTALNGAPLPVQTCAMLMQHYERVGEFAKAEDALYGMLEAEPDNPRILEFGVGFYRRLKSQTDDALSAGNFSRQEIEQGLRELGMRGA